MSSADYFTKTPVVGNTLARSTAINTNLTAIETFAGRLPDRAITDTGRITFAVTGGAADVYTLTMHKTPSSYYNGMALDIEVHATNTGACTINVDSLGAKAIKIMNGTDPAAGDLTAGDYLTLRYDDTNGYFVITSTVRSIINGNASMSDLDIKTAYENNADTNAFTDAQETKVNYLTVTGAVNLDSIGAKIGYLTVTGAVNLDSMNTKLSGIEAGATADQSNAEIKTAYESNANTNAFTDAQQTKVNYLTVTGAVNLDSMNTKLSGIEAGATADQSDAEIKTAYENNSNTNAFTDAQQTKVNYLTVTGATNLDTIRGYNTLSANGTSEASKAAITDASGNMIFSEEVQAKAYLGTVVSLSGTTPSVDCNTGNAFTLSTTGNTTFTFDYSGVDLTTNDVYGFLLKITAGGTHTLTWPASVDWAYSNTPSAPASGNTSIYGFVTVDGGTTWFGYLVGEDMA